MCQCSIVSPACSPWTNTSKDTHALSRFCVLNTAIIIICESAGRRRRRLCCHPSSVPSSWLDANQQRDKNERRRRRHVNQVNNNIMRFDGQGGRIDIVLATRIFRPLCENSLVGRRSLLRETHLTYRGWFKLPWKWFVFITSTTTNGANRMVQWRRWQDNNTMNSPCFVNNIPSFAHNSLASGSWTPESSIEWHAEMIFEEQKGTWINLTYLWNALT